jgi:uncharacterized membrane protein YfcA
MQPQGWRAGLASALIPRNLPPWSFGYVPSVITDPLFYLIALPCVVALGLSKGGFSGVGQIATPLLALIMPPLEAAAILLPIMLAQDAVSMWVYRRDYSGWNLKVMLPGAIVGIGAAWLLASYISDAAIRMMLGVITLVFVLYSWFGPKRLAEEVGRASAVGGAVWGALSGFTSTLCQAGGPPYQMHVFPQQLPKMTFVGTTALFFGIVNALKVIPYFALGQFSTAGLTTSAALLPLALLTNALGIWLVRITPQALFYRLTMIMLFLLSLELVRSGAIDLWFNR